MEFKEGYIACHFSSVFFFIDCVILQRMFKVYGSGPCSFLEKMVTRNS